MKSKMFRDNEIEAIMMGGTVAVCRNLTWQGTKLVKDPKAEWYIDFLDVRDGDYIDEDSPVEGGIDVEYARELIEELEAAIEYLNQEGMKGN